LREAVDQSMAEELANLKTLYDKKKKEKKSKKKKKGGKKDKNAHA